MSRRQAEQRLPLYKWWRRDTKEDRQLMQHKFRQRTRQAIVHEAWEDVPPWVPSRGWESW